MSLILANTIYLEEEIEKMANMRQTLFYLLMHQHEELQVFGLGGFFTAKI